MANNNLNKKVTIGIFYLIIFLFNVYLIKVNRQQIRDVRVSAQYVTPTPTPSGCRDSYGSLVPDGGSTSQTGLCFGTTYSCSTSLDGATGSCSFDSASSYCVCNNGSWNKVGPGCHASFSCASGYTSSPPATGLYSVHESHCETCGNSSTTCYKLEQEACSVLGGTCYSTTQGSNTVTSCSGLNSLYPAYTYSSVNGYCSSGFCCTQTAKTTCAQNGGSCGSTTCAARTSASSTTDYSSLSGYCDASTPYCCSASTRPKCVCGDTTTRTCGTVYTVSGANCQTVSCTGTGPVAGGWTAYTYSSWGTCSSCTQSRTGTRTCTNPAPACGGAACVGSATITENQSCDLVDGTWSSWSTCGVSCGTCTQSRTCVGQACGGASCSGSSTQVVDLGCCPVNGSSASCGGTAGTMYVSAPTTGLCNTGSSSAVTTTGTLFTWTCYGTAGSCGGYSGSNASCSAPRALAPTLSGFEIRNTSDAIIAAESGNVNHICQAEFNKGAARFVVTGNDPNGSSDITSIQLRMGSLVYSPKSLAAGVATFDIPYSSTNNSSSAVSIEVNITDSTGQSTGWVGTGRSFKFWDCLISVSGTLYDGSKAVFEVINCGAGSQDFSTPAKSSMAYGLTFAGVALDSDRAMTVSAPGYNSGSNKLLWGAQYRAVFTNVDGNTPVMKYPGNNTCNSTSASFTVDNSSQIGANPYGSSQSIVLDFSSILSQFSWFQVAGGGVLAKNTINNNIPNTCIDACKANITISAGSDNPNGLVAAQTITKGSGSFGEVNNWGVNTNVIGTSYGYKYFYNEYYLKLGQGTMYGVGKSMSQIIADGHNSGVVFVNGKVTIDTDNTVPEGTFFMLVSSGDIEINSSVNNVQGILISDGNIIAAGTSDNQLRIDGSVYASKNDIKFSRGFATGTLNNRNPAVVVTYRPDFIFSMPGKLTKILSGWREGI